MTQFRHLLNFSACHSWCIVSISTVHTANYTWHLHNTFHRGPETYKCSYSGRLSCLWSAMCQSLCGDVIKHTVNVFKNMISPFCLFVFTGSSQGSSFVSAYGLFNCHQGRAIQKINPTKKRTTTTTTSTCLYHFI